MWHSFPDRETEVLRSVSMHILRLVPEVVWISLHGLHDIPLKFPEVT